MTRYLPQYTNDLALEPIAAFRLTTVSEADGRLGPSHTVLHLRNTSQSSGVLLFDSSFVVRVPLGDRCRYCIGDIFDLVPRPQD